MPRAPEIEELIEELDQAMVALRAARRRAAEGLTAARPGRGSGGRGISLRFTGMTVVQAAARLGMSEEHVRRLLRRGELQGVPFGGRIGWRLDRSHVEAVAASWRCGGATARPQHRAGALGHDGPT